MIGCYNSSMGGTDQINQSIASYRPFIRNRKWYWPLFLYSVEVSLYSHGCYIEVWKKNVHFLITYYNVIFASVQVCQNKSFHQQRQFSITVAISKQVVDSLDLMG